jgi:hypothetical protein
MALTASRSRSRRKAASLGSRKSPSARVASAERYSPARKAEFLLNNAVTVAEYRTARAAVTELGIDPDSIPHRAPNSR